MNVLFISSVGIVAADPPESRKLFVDALGLPLNAAGVTTSPDDFFTALGAHRHWNR